MIPLNAILVPLSAALGLSVVVERILEFIQNVFERFLGGQAGRKIPDEAGAKKQIDELEKTHVAAARQQEIEKKAEEVAKQRAMLQATTDPAKRKELTDELAQFEKDGEWGERFSDSIIIVEEATDPDDGKTFKAFIVQLLGFAAGIIAAHYGGLQLFNSFLKALGKPEMAPWLDYMLTGLFIGGGSGPVHTLIRFISERKVSADDAAPAKSETQMVAAIAPAIIVPRPEPEDVEWVDIPYDGGVDREKLEGIHRRPADPNLVVYHHTAMSSRSTFEDVVRVIKSRTDSQGNHWITGYNCVILADGSIHAFCRWDRYGNHAVGYNRQSLGITFNGNFETNPKVPFSNPDGRFGAPRPTEAQLKAGARIVTLWSLIYPIPIDFEKAIIPHKQISPKTCPGNMFPYDEFKKLVEFYRGQWEKSAAVKQRIASFKLKPYLYVEKGGKTA